ncbi:MAG: hypothetical protein OEY29_00190 [Gammaproteobacteria bacterium]|nr:hypothetical protein [Gammaproteobacteria bacterium]
MKISARFIILCSILIAFSNPLYARGNAAYEETYNVGLVAASLDGGSEFGTVDATGFTLSARNQKAVLEYINLSADPGVIATGIYTGDAWESSITGFYLSLLGEGQPYMKIKVGKIKQEMVRTPATGIATTETNSVTSYGIGLGYKVGARLVLEFDVTTLDNDMTLMAFSVLF